MQIIKVSVIIPMLNAASYIKECLESVIRQTLQEIEIWCVDAGSTDGTPDIVREYSAIDSRIRLLESSKKSYGYQVNMGIDAAKGFYIGIIEPDDYILEDMFEKLYYAAWENQLDFVKSNFYKFMDYMGKRYYQKWERSAWGNRICYDRVILLKDTPQALVYGDHGNIWSGIYRRGFLTDKRIRLHETPGASYQDTGFALLCSMEAERVMYLKDAFYYYRQDNTNSSVSSQEKHSTIINEYQWIWEQMQERKLTDAISRSFYMAMKFHSYLWNYNRLHADSRQKFLENLAKDKIFDFDETLVSYVVPEKDKMLALWKGDWSDVQKKNVRDEKRRNSARELLGIFRKVSRMVIVCAGEQAVSLLELEDRLETAKVCAVCDNSLSVQGTSVVNRKVISVAEAVAGYPDAYFVIANERHVQEVQGQLLSMGIKEEKMCVWKERVRTGGKFIDFLLLDDTTCHSKEEAEK